MKLINLNKASLRIQAHWLVAQKTTHDQNQPKSLPTPTHGRQKRCSKLRRKMTENKEHQPLTSGHKTLGVKWLNESSASHQGLVSGDTFAAPKSPTFHTADRYGQG